MPDYDVIIIGGGHAGIEAALASARMGCRVLLITLDAKSIGALSCNPAIGGVGKGQLVKEIDALGGEMARAADACAIQFRILNASKGPAVQSSRAQVDMDKYKAYMQGVISAQENIKVKEAQVTRLLMYNGAACGVVTDREESISAQAVVVAPGTFLEGLIHIGLRNFSAGRIGEPAAGLLAQDLRQSGFRLLRFKTGTCARLDKETIDFSRLKIQEGDTPARPFSFLTERITQGQVPCHITYTNAKTHEIIRRNLGRSPLYSGRIKATGVRYCPSIEDKVVKFSDRPRHQVFLEPQGISCAEIYPNGLSTSLPEDVQLEFIHSIEGLEQARVIRFGYGIEHTVVEPTQLYPTLETKLIKRLYLAGQINGTTGYEEAAAQGLVAGINASLAVKNKEPLVLERANSYIGVLIDDLTTKGTEEPYRMFTSRVEYRLILREDNADLRLTRTGYNLGLADGQRHRKLEEKEQAIKKGMAFVRETHIGPPRVSKTATLEQLLRRPEVSVEALRGFGQITPEVPEFALRQVEIEVKYAGFIQRQLRDVEKFRNLEKIKLPADMDYAQVGALSREIKEKLNKFRPLNLGQASRISGVTPVAISLLMVFLRKINAER